MSLTSDFHYNTHLMYMQQEPANQKGFTHQNKEATVQDVPMISLSQIVYFIHQK